MLESYAYNSDDDKCGHGSQTPSVLCCSYCVFVVFIVQGLCWLSVFIYSHVLFEVSEQLKVTPNSTQDTYAKPLGVDMTHEDPPAVFFMARVLRNTLR